MIKLSIITINYNNFEGLRKTIASVRNQNCRDYEFVVVDGGSTDGSVDLIKENADIIDKWVSEPDKGIYNAMNKGVKMASGDYITFLNSGDSLYDNNVISESLKVLSEPKAEKIIFGQVMNDYGKSKQLYKFSRPLTLLSLYYDVVNHSGTFIERELQLKHPYREDLKICSDRQFFIEAIVLDNCSYGHIDRVITLFDKTGISSSDNSDLLMAQENELIFTSLFPPRIVADYKKTNLILADLTEKLAPYHRFSKLLCKFDRFALKIYSFFKK